VVALPATSELALLDPELELIATIALSGLPQALALAHDGRTLVAPHFLSRGATGTVSVVDLTNRVETAAVALVDDPGPDTPSSGRGVPNLLGAVVLHPAGSAAWLGGLKSNTGRGLHVSGEPLTPSNRLRGVALRLRLGDTGAAEDLTARIDTQDADSASALAFSPDRGSASSASTMCRGSRRRAAATAPPSHSRHAWPWATRPAVSPCHPTVRASTSPTSSAVASPPSTPADQTRR
jgi:hypothetical protein